MRGIQNTADPRLRSLASFRSKCPGDELTALQTSRNSAVNCNSVPKIMGVGLKSCSAALKEE